MSTPDCTSKTGLARETIISGGQTMRCVGRGVWQADDGTLRFANTAAKEQWYREHPGAMIAGALPPWAPWVIGGVAVGGVAWLAFRK